MIKRSKDRLYHFFYGGEQFKKQVKKQLRLFIAITLGVTIAFSWRQTIFDIFQALVQFLFAPNSEAYSSIITSTIITIVSLILLFITFYLIRDD